MFNSSIREDAFDSAKLHHKETVFTLGNGYLSTRGSFEEGYPGDHAATFAHGVFDDVPIVFTELANLPDWTEMHLCLAGERFSLAEGEILRFERLLNLREGVLRREVRWRSPLGRVYDLHFERFASLADEHVLCLRVAVTPRDDSAAIEFQAGLDGSADNLGMLHWNWVAQRVENTAALLRLRTRASGIELGMAMRLYLTPTPLSEKGEGWDVQNHPTLAAVRHAEAGETIVAEKMVAVYTSRDLPNPAEAAWEKLSYLPDWDSLLIAQRSAWEREWERCDVLIEGDDEVQLAVRFCLFQLLIAAPRHDERVNIGAKTLSGFGYRGHTFWDTETFMLPFFTFTRPEIARNLLSYRWHTLPGARRKAKGNGYAGAQYAWESAATGDEVTPTWVPHFADPKGLVRIWTGDIEIHVSADVVYGIHQYWRLSGDDAFLLERGLEIILETARFWASRAEWNAEKDRFEFSDVIGPDEYHDHVDNNAFTNYLARWHLLEAAEMLEWAESHYPKEAQRWIGQLDLTGEERARWQEVARLIYFPFDHKTRLIEQFEGYFQRREVNIAEYAHLQKSMQVVFGIEGCAETQILKQPDVLMLQYLLPDEFDPDIVQANYVYYTPRTDHAYGSSLGPAIQAIMACRMDRPEEAYEHFLRAARADLYDVRGNAGDGIHGASAGGLWQAVVFGFGGLRLSGDGWRVEPRLPPHWKRLAFKFVYRGEVQEVDTSSPGPSPISHGDGVGAGVRGFIFDLDGVLTDTAEYHYRGWKRLADEEGIPFTREDNEAMRGIPRRESLLVLLKGRQFPEDQLQEMMERKNRYYQEFICEVTADDLLPGAKALLEELRAAGIKIAIGSASKNTGEVVDRLGIRPLLDAISDGYSVERQKPAPDLFLHAAAQLGLSPAECVVVEDAAAGVEAAKAGGFRTIGLGPVERVGEADLVLPNLSQMRLSDILGLIR
jgi:kojibiose phosphorylase